MYGIMHPRHRNGFTLIEMLVVVAIMGLLVGLISVVTRPDARGVLRLEADRLAQLLDFAAAEAGFTGKTIGWTATAGGYQFWRLREDTGWSQIRDSELLRERTLPAGMTIAALRVENLRPQGGMRLEFAPYAPPLFFTVELTLGAEHYAVEALASGSVRAVAVDGPGYGAPAL